jgi:hypothetical protein
MRSSKTAKVSSKRRSICARRSSAVTGPEPPPLLPPALPAALPPGLPPAGAVAPPVWPADRPCDWPAVWPGELPDGDRAPVFGACPDGPEPSDVGVGQRCGAGSPALPGEEPAESLADGEPGAPPDDPG